MAQSIIDSVLGWQANVAWAVGKLSHFHQGLLDAMAEHAVSMVKVCLLWLQRFPVVAECIEQSCSMGLIAPFPLMSHPHLLS